MTLSADISSEIKSRIETAINDADVAVTDNGNRHYALAVTANAFAGLTQVKQHQLVYSAIKELMSGDDAPIHAIDRMDIQLRQ
jgi:stress-induced morphogen